MYVDHDSAIQGNTICSMYLIVRGANINELDMDGNNALGLALQVYMFIVNLILLLGQSR
jgi:FtsH-binding integral membrane protein